MRERNEQGLSGAKAQEVTSSHQRNTALNNIIPRTHLLSTIPTEALRLINNGNTTIITLGKIIEYHKQPL